jgi:cytochrome c
MSEVEWLLLCRAQKKLRGERAMALLRTIGRWGAALLLIASAATPAHAQDVAAGAKIAGTHCARCHAIGQTGASPHPSAPPFRAIAAKGHVDDLQEALAEGITVGHSDMPEFALLPENIADLLAYIKGLANGK